MNVAETFIDRLMKALSIISAPADRQVEYLKDLGGASVDELGLEFEDVWRQSGVILNSNGITQLQYNAIEALNKKFDQLSSDENENFWTEDALFKDNEWEKVRSLAKEIISSITIIENSLQQK